MSKVKMVNVNGEKIKDLTLNKNVWGVEPNDSVLYDAIKLTRNAQRQGTSSTKTRSEVRGGGRKPWRQKGTGNARHGTIRSPLWTGGGITFGPKPRKYDIKMNKKERRLALLSALSYKALDKELIVVDNLEVKEPKTKEMINILNNLKVDKKVLIVVEELTDNLVLAARNLERVLVLQADEINTFDVVNSDNMIITENALKSIEEVLGYEK